MIVFAHVTSLARKRITVNPSGPMTNGTVDPAPSGGNDHPQWEGVYASTGHWIRQEESFEPLDLFGQSLDFSLDGSHLPRSDSH